MSNIENVMGMARELVGARLPPANTSWEEIEEFLNLLLTPEAGPQVGYNDRRRPCRRSLLSALADEIRWGTLRDALMDATEAPAWVALEADYAGAQDEADRRALSCAADAKAADNAARGQLVADYVRRIAAIEILDGDRRRWATTDAVYQEDRWAEDRGSWEAAMELCPAALAAVARLEEEAAENHSLFFADQDAVRTAAAVARTALRATADAEWRQLWHARSVAKKEADLTADFAAAKEEASAALPWFAGETSPHYTHSGYWAGKEDDDHDMGTTRSVVVILAGKWRRLNEVADLGATSLTEAEEFLVELDAANNT